MHTILPLNWQLIRIRIGGWFKKIFSGLFSIKFHWTPKFQPLCNTPYHCDGMHLVGVKLSPKLPSINQLVFSVEWILTRKQFGIFLHNLVIWRANQCQYIFGWKNENIQIEFLVLCTFHSILIAPADHQWEMENRKWKWWQIMANGLKCNFYTWDYHTETIRNLQSKLHQIAKFIKFVEDACFRITVRVHALWTFLNSMDWFELVHNHICGIFRNRNIHMAHISTETMTIKNYSNNSFRFVN